MKAFIFLSTGFPILTYSQSAVPNDLYLSSIKGRLLIKKGEAGKLMMIALYSNSSILIKTTVTDSIGRFTFERIKGKQSYFIGINSTSGKVLKLADININQEGQQLNIGTVVINSETITLKEVNVMSNRPYIQRKLDRLIVNINENSILSGNTLNELLPKLPGISLNEKNEIVVNGKGGVLILIDGKGQYVNRDQLGSVLNNLRAETIDKIEIISNPSVKYDSNGSTVINVITKKDKMLSDLHASGGQQIAPVNGLNGVNRPAYAIGTNLNYLIGKLRTFLSLDYGYQKSFQQNNNLLKYDTPDFLRSQLVSSDAFNSTINARFGFNADLSKSTALDGTFSFYSPLRSNYQRQYSQAFYSGSERVPDSLIKSSGRDRFTDNHNNTINLRLSHILNSTKNEEIAFFFDYNDYLFRLQSGLGSSYFKTNEQLYATEDFQNLHSYQVKILSVKSDYSLKLNKGLQLEAGAKITHIVNHDDYESVITASNENAVETTFFNYRETVTAAYLNFVGSGKHFDYQLGGRLESTSSLGVAPNLNQDYSRDYLNFFPAFTIQHNFKSKIRQQLVLSYNRRIVRPGYGDFNPNSNPTNRFSNTSGQPSLNPQYLNNLEVGYNRSSLAITVTESYRTNVKEVLPQKTSQGLVQDNQITSYSYQNTLGLNISFPITITKWWTSSNMVSGIYNQTQLLDNSISRFSNYNLSTSHTIAINKKNKIDLRLYYRPEYTITYGKMHEVTSLSAGYRLSAMRDKLLISFTVNDVLGKTKLSYYQDFGEVYIAQLALKNDRYYRISLRYAIELGRKFSIRNKRSKNDNSEIRLN